MGYVRIHLTDPYIDDDALAARHESLFHYTTLAAFARIMESGGLWSSHYRTLSDRSEYRIATQKVSDRIYDLKRDATRAEVLRHPGTRQRILKDYETVDDLVRKDTPTLPRAICAVSDKHTPMHVSSFATHVPRHEATGGILSLWREYGREDGIALRFNTRKVLRRLSEIKASESYFALFLGTVTYGDDDPLFTRRVNGMDDLAESYQCVVEAMLRGQKTGFPPSFEEASTKFSITSILHKHPAFADEREVRLVASPIISDEPEDVPRKTPEWVDATSGASRLLIRCLDAIDGIMIGPVERQEHLAETAIKLLRSYGHSDIPITVSDIPTQIRAR